MEVRMEPKKEAFPHWHRPGGSRRFSNIFRPHPKEWAEGSQQDPGRFANLEQEIHRAFAQMADRVVAGLLAQATAGPDFTARPRKK